jgi:uncharacterized membrane protein
VHNRPGPDTLQNTVEALIDVNLAFFPGERMEYGTLNYDVLGLVIETVSGQSFEAFMEEQIFRLLGLTHTYANRNRAEAAGRLSPGYRNDFIFNTVRFDSPEAGGSIPAGYIISSAQDMARWMGIQMGNVQDIPAVFHTIISKSHEQGQSVAAPDDSYYAAGWFISEDQTIIEHGGGNPGFSTYVLLFPDEKVGITVLANASGVNAKLIAENIKAILDGDLAQTYSMGATQILDIVLSIVTVIGGLLAILFFISGFRRKKQAQKQSVSKKRVALIIIWIAVTFTVLCVLCFSDFFFAGGWSVALMWMSFSLLSAVISLTLLCGSIVWFVLSPALPKSTSQ